MKRIKNYNWVYLTGIVLAVFTLSCEEKKPPVLSTVKVTEITENTANSGGNITDDRGADITARGIVWGTSQNPTVDNNDGITTDGTGSGQFTSHIKELSAGTTYYVRAYAINSAGTSYGNQLSFAPMWWSKDSNTEVVEVFNPATGRTWMDRNLGASRAATSSTDAEAYGDLYQWGRAADGHQLRTSNKTSTWSNSDNPGHGNFITISGSPYDWSSPQNDNLWQGVNGTNNPCPDGYRLPTVAELVAELDSWSSNNPAGAFASPLKWTVAGSRLYSDGSLNNVGSFGRYWSSTLYSTDSRSLTFYSSFTMVDKDHRAYGLSVRCIKD